MITLQAVTVAVVLALVSLPCRGQQTAIATLPDAPVPQPAAQASTADAQAPVGPQPKRIFGIFPNYRSVSVDEHLPPQSVKEKFVTATRDSFDYSAIVFPLVIVTEEQGSGADPEFGTGGAAFWRYLWRASVDQTSENYIVEFLVPALTREDTRYYALHKRRQRAWKRLGYAVSRLVITRSDSGRKTVNIGELAGAAIGASVSSLYYPASERTASKIAGRYETNLGVDIFGFVLREFWPDANHILFRGPNPLDVP
jgi:hypothetical protein